MPPGELTEGFLKKWEMLYHFTALKKMSPNSQPFVHYFLFREGNTTSILKENESLFITEEEGSLVLSFSHVGLHSVSGGGDFSLLKDVSGGKLLGSF